MTTTTYPNDLLYTKDHEWARVEDQNGEKVVTVGITRFAVQQLGDVTQVELPKAGESVTHGAVFGSVESDGLDRLQVIPCGAPGVGLEMAVYLDRKLCTCPPFETPDEAR